MWLHKSPAHMRDETMSARLQYVHIHGERGVVLGAQSCSQVDELRSGDEFYVEDHAIAVTVVPTSRRRDDGSC